MKALEIMFIIFVSIFAAIQIMLLLDLQLPVWVTSYVNDFLCMPLVLFICLKAARYGNDNPNLQLPLFSIISLTIFYAIFFEVLLPEFHARYTADWLDVIMYFMGAVLFYFLQKMENEESRIISAEHDQNTE